MYGGIKYGFTLNCFLSVDALHGRRLTCVVWTCRRGNDVCFHYVTRVKVLTAESASVVT